MGTMQNNEGSDKFREWAFELSCFLLYVCYLYSLYVLQSKEIFTLQLISGEYYDHFNVSSSSSSQLGRLVTTKSFHKMSLGYACRIPSCIIHNEFLLSNFCILMAILWNNTNNANGHT